MSKEFKFTNLPKEFIDKVKALKDEFSLINSAPAQAATVVTPPAAAFGEGELEDGSKVKWEGETLAAGIPLMIVDPANPEGFLPAADGEYKMKDGTVLKVTEGKITEVIPAAPVTPPAPEAQTAIPAVVAQMAKVESELKEVKENFSKVSKEKESLEAAFSKKIEDQNKVIAGVLELFNEMVKQPISEPVVTPTVTPSKSKSQRMIERMQNPNN